MLSINLVVVVVVGGGGGCGGWWLLKASSSKPSAERLFHRESYIITDYDPADLESGLRMIHKFNTFRYILTSFQLISMLIATHILCTICEL